MNQIIRDIEKQYIKQDGDLPELHIGDTVKVFVKIIEGGKERTQGYEGVIIKRRGSGVGETITVRRVFQGIGIERVFPLNSPRLEKIKVQRRGHVRRAKLYYLRKRTGKLHVSKKDRQRFQKGKGNAPEIEDVQGPSEE
jgi:ribosomal protein L19, bacterial type